jgi:hypothetical protein
MTPGPSVAAKRPIPDKAEQLRSRTLMRELFAKQLADKSAPGRRKLAEVLLAESVKVADNVVDQYVLLAATIEAAKQAGWLQACFQAADLMAARFDVDALALKSDSTIQANPNVEPAFVEENVRIGLVMSEQLLEAEDFTAASGVAAKLMPAATATKNADLRAAVQQRLREAATLRAARERVTAQMERLKTAPDDPAACMVVGSYLCFSKADWRNGLPLLAKSSNPFLKAAAAADLANPKESDAQISVGDAWWLLGDKEAPGATQIAARLRGGAWYRIALASGKVTGLARSRIERRIESIMADIAATHPPKWISREATYTLSSQLMTAYPNLLNGVGGGSGEPSPNVWAFRTKTEPQPFVVIDLGNRAIVTGMDIVNRRDINAKNRATFIPMAKTLTAWVSDNSDGPWEEVWRAEEAQQEWTVKLSRPVYARFVKLGLRENNMLSLFSVKILGYRGADLLD